MLYAHGDTRGDLVDGAADDAEAPPHDVPPHPSDPHDAIGTTSREVCDPELIRGPYAAALGKTMFAVGERLLFGPEGLVHSLERGIAGIRKGAVVRPAQRSTGEQLATVKATEHDQKTERRWGEAAKLRAARLSTDLERQEELLEAERQAAQTAREQVEARRAARAEVRDATPPTAVSQPELPPGPVFGWLRLPTWVAVTVATIDLLVTAILLESPLTTLVPTTLPFGSGPYVMAAGIAAATLAAAATAGFAVAALRLPARAVSLLTLVAVGLIGLKLVPAIDAARANEDQGVEMLTAATLCACLVAAMTAYSTTTHRIYDRLRARVQADDARGDALTDADLLVEEAERSHRKCLGAVEERETACNTLRKQIDDLLTFHEQTDIRVERRGATGVRAETQLETIRSRCEAECAQEDHSRAAAEAAAELAWRKVRAEELPERDDDGATTPPPQPLRIVEQAAAEPPAPRLGWSEIGAVLVLAGSGVGAAALSAPVVFAAGAGTAAVALVLGLRRPGGHSGSGPETGRGAGGSGPDDPRGPRVKPSADSDSADWIPQPDRLYARYGAGEHDPTQGQ